MPTATRKFRVFVSSTFEDLRAERNVLQEKVFPELEQFCLEKGASFQAIDLRWGVREEAGLDQKTMEICLAEIARCQRTRIKPNFIVLLGDRYGWRPLPARIQKDEFETVLAHIDETGERDFVVSWYDLDLNAVPPEYILKPRKGIYTDWKQWEPVEQRIHRALRDGARAAGLPPQTLVKYEASATHQEILKGLGETAEDRAHVFAFFRESDGYEDPDLAKVKDHLKAVLPAGNIFPWSAGDHARLCDDLEQSLTTIIAATAAQFEIQSEKASHGRFAEDRAKYFQGRETVLDAIERYLRGDDRRPLVVFGPSGSGKSAILAVASQGKDAIRRFIGATPESSSGVTLLRSLCRELGERFGQTGDLPATFNELSAMFSERLKLAKVEQPVILFIDALDQLSAQDPAAAMRWLPVELPPWCHVVLSTTEIPAAIRRAAMVAVERLPVEDADLALNSWFTEARRKLQPEQREKLLANFLRSGLPLYLKLAFEEARLWRSFDPLGDCVLGDGLQGIIDRLFGRLSDPANHGEILVSHVLGYLTAARYGLTEDEILAVLTKDEVVWKDAVGEGVRRRHDPPLRQLPVIVWSRLHLDLEPYLTERTVPGGTTVSFYHRQLAERVETTQLHHKALATHFAGQSHWLGGSVPNRRKLTELVRQQVGAGLPDDAAEVLTDLDFVSAKCAAELVFDLEEDYREVIAALPEAQEALRDEERRQTELSRWTRTLIECAEQRRLPEPKEIIKSVEPWSHERIAAESTRIIEDPTRLDRLKAFAGFIEQELYPLVEFGTRPGFAVQHAFNSAPTGPIHAAAHTVAGAVAFPILLRSWPNGENYAPTTALLRILEGHSISVSSVSMTSDGRRVVSAGSRDNTLRVWDLETGACLRTLQGHTDSVIRVSITPDGRRAVSASGDKTLRVWDPETGVCLRTLEGHTGSVISVSMTPDGRRAVSASGDKTLRVWDPETGVCLRTDDHNDSVGSVIVTPNGRRALYVWSEYYLGAWDPETGKWLGELRGRTEPITSVTVTPDGRRAVSGSDDSTLRLWDAETGACLRTLKGHTNRITSVDVTPDGRRVISGSYDNTVRFWDAETGACLRTLKGHTDSVTSVSVTPDGRRAVSGSYDKTVRVWNLETGACLPTENSHIREVTVTVTPDGRRGVSKGWDKTVRVWDLKTGVCLRSLEGHTASVTSISVTPDGQRVVSGSEDETLKVWDLETGACRHTLQGHMGCLCAVTVTPDGKRVVSASSDKTLRVWDLNTGACLCILKSHTDPAFCCTYTLTPDGRRALSASHDKSLRLWNLETGRCLRTLEGHTSMIFSVCATPDGVMAVSGSMDNTIRMWDLDTGACLNTLKGHTASIYGVIVTPDGRRAVSRSYDKTLRIWDLETRTCLHILKGHTDEITTVTVMPDGRRVVSASDDRTLRIWNLETGSCEALLRISAPVRSVAMSEQLNRLIVGTSTGNVMFYDIRNIGMRAAAGSLDA